MISHHRGSLPALALLAGCALPAFCEDQLMTDESAPELHAMMTEPPPLPAVPEPTPEPTPDPAIQAALDAALIEAIVNGDHNAMRIALNDGASPDAGFPIAAPPELLERIPDGPLTYYTRKEPGFTALMLAAGLGDEIAVRFLLAAGADIHRLTHRNKTFALYIAAKAGQIEIMRILMGILPDSEAAQVRLAVDLQDQRVVLWKGAEILSSSKISSGKRSTPTPRGRYLVTNKYRHWKSTLFDAKMPYFLRLSCGDFGLHAGVVPGYPASHGCIRLPARNAKEFFASIPVGALVEIK